MEVTETVKRPIAQRQKLQLIQRYIHKVELSGIADIIRDDLLLLGLVISGDRSIVSASNGTRSSDSSSSILSSTSFNLSWLNYKQFKNLFYFQCKSLLEEDSMLNLRMLINNTASWEGPEMIVSRLKQYFLIAVNKNLQRKNIKWIEDLLQFWTSKKHCIPTRATIEVLRSTEYENKPRPTSSACFNKLIFPSYMAENYHTFESMLNESIKSLKYGFTSW